MRLIVRFPEWKEGELRSRTCEFWSHTKILVRETVDLSIANTLDPDTIPCNRTD